MSQSKVLADRIFPAEGLAADVVRIAAANILLVLCAHIAFPLPWTPVPVTGQTFGVLLIAILLGSRRGALTLGLYLLEGMAGLPVLQPLGLPGPARFLGPTAGYLLAYPPAAFVTGWLMERGASGARTHFASLRASGAKLIGALVSGEVIIFAVGCPCVSRGPRSGWANSLRPGALPFRPCEILKMRLTAAAGGGLKSARPK